MDELTEQVIGAGTRIDRALGPGRLESAYEECLCYELSKSNLRFERQKPLPLSYEGVQLDCGYRLELVIEEALIVELKMVEKLLPIHDAQFLTYPKLAVLALGLLMNFKVPMLKEGIRRITNNYSPFFASLRC